MYDIMVTSNKEAGVRWETREGRVGDYFSNKSAWHWGTAMVSYKDVYHIVTRILVANGNGSHLVRGDGMVNTH